MTTYSAEVNIYNPEAIADAVDEAGETASTYITEVTGGGIQVHPASNTNDYTQIDSSGVKLYKGGVQVAEFGASGAIIGKLGAAHSVIDADGQRFYGGSDGTVQLANIGYGDGTAQSGTAVAPYYTFGTREAAILPYNSTATYAEGDLCLRNSKAYACIVAITTPEAWNDEHWQLANGIYSLAEGYDVTASGRHSHAEGYRSEALGAYSHAEGYNAKAVKAASHAEGVDTIAKGFYSHAQNNGTVAAYDNQTTIGKYNDNQSINAFEIGNGTSDADRSNAFMVDWDGYIYRDNETAHIGSIFTNSASNLRRTGTNIDSLMIGTSVSLPPGTYVITAYWTFNTGTSGATSRNLEVAIGSGTSNAWNFTRTNCYGYGYQRLTTYCIRAITQTTTVYVMGSGSQATNASYLDDAGIQAVKIV